MATRSLRTQSTENHQGCRTTSLFLASGRAAFLPPLRNKTPPIHPKLPKFQDVLAQVVKSPSLPWTAHHRRRLSPYDPFCQVIPSYTSDPINFVCSFRLRRHLFDSSARSKGSGQQHWTSNATDLPFSTPCQDSSYQVICSHCGPAICTRSLRNSSRSSWAPSFCPQCIMSNAVSAGRSPS